MKRPSFTVESGGVSYDANHLRYAWKTGIGWIISFISSGEEKEIQTSQVSSVKFLNEFFSEVNWCGECDAPMNFTRVKS
jgi:hypothetical protein